MNSPRHFLLWHAFGLLLLVTSPGASAVQLPDDPAQSIVFWKPHIVSPGADKDVQRVQDIFHILLRTWDGTRIAPALHVVDSSTGPWAASLADGNILLSLDAVRTCLSFGEQRAQNLLAFVLAHELAHQRADDLWHQKFFRLIGNQSPERQKRLLRGIDTEWLNDIEEKEAQADHDAVVIMASVGYDPYQILDKHDFFTAWVEQLWKGSCSNVAAADSSYGACQQAKTRRLRAQTQLQTLASQATIYDLAMQAFVSGNYVEARRLLQVYGRELPSRAVYTSIGLSYLAEALQLKQDENYLQDSGEAALFYPIVLDTEPYPLHTQTAAPVKRGVEAEARLKQQRAQITALAEKAGDNFNKAIKLNPGHKRSYLMLSLSYLLSGNTYMAHGVLQGQYQPRFGEDAALRLLLALTAAVEGKDHEAVKLLSRLSKTLIRTDTQKTETETEAQLALPRSLLTYATQHNLALLQNRLHQSKSTSSPWRDLADRAKKDANALLFQMALAQLKPQREKTLSIDEHPSIMQLRPGDPFSEQANPSAKQWQRSEIWIEGEKQLMYRLPAEGARFLVNNKQEVVNAWQQQGDNAGLGRLKIGDRLDRSVAILGVPDRELFFTRGTYLAYDRYGLGIQVLNDKIVGWFLYAKSTP